MRSWGKGSATYRVISLGCGDEPIDPGQKFLSAVVRVKNHWHTVLLRHGADVESAGDGAGNGSFVVLVVEAFASEELCATGGKLARKEGNCREITPRESSSGQTVPQTNSANGILPG